MPGDRSFAILRARAGGNGVAERFIRTLKENLLWVRTFDTVEELRAAPATAELPVLVVSGTARAEAGVASSGLPAPLAVDWVVKPFQEGQLVDVIGITKGKGFQGVVKRFRVGGGPAAHGSMFHRRIGSIGMRQTPGRTWKNQAMPGHMGSQRRTAQNLRVVKVIADKNLILVKGAIPGANGDDVIVRTAIKGQPKTAA